MTAALPACASRSMDDVVVDDRNALSPGNGGARVVIVGAGMAGLHCAYRLRKAGITAPVYEASSRLGGRMLSDRSSFPNGQHCEIGAELIDTNHTVMHELAKELGIELYDLATDAPSLSPFTGYIGGERFSSDDMLREFEPIAKAIEQSLKQLKDADAEVTFDNPNGVEGLDKLSIPEWFDRNRISGRLRKAIEVGYTGYFGREASDQSALNMLMQFETGAKKFEMYGESDERFYTKSGNDTYIRKLAERLEAGQVRLNSLLVSIRRRPDGVYALGFRNPKGPGSTWEILADHVVIAVPFTTLRQVAGLEKLVSQEKLRVIRELGYGTNAKVMMGVNRRVWRDYGAAGYMFTDLPCQSTWESSRLQPGATGILTNFLGGTVGALAPTKSKELLRDSAAADIDRVWPGFRGALNGVVAVGLWASYPHSLGSYSCYRPGQWTTLRGLEGKAHDALHFAGEHTSFESQGMMNGAAESGARVAENVVAALGMAKARSKG